VGQKIDQIGRTLAKLPPRPGLDPETLRDWAIRLWIVGRAREFHRQNPPHAETRQEAVKRLKGLAAAYRKLGPRARAQFSLALKAYGTEVGSVEFMAAIEFAVARIRKGVRRGRPEAAMAAMLAEHTAWAYFEITGKTPPTSDAYQRGRDEPQQPYHRLVQAVFEVFKFPAWQSHARIAAQAMRRDSIRPEIT
jgi:hypothetical protein